MKITDLKVYRCDHCGKAKIGKGAMTLHERMCKENPNNKHKCFQYCIHLQRHENPENYPNVVSFSCAKTCKELYSFKIERWKSNVDRIKDLERMPLECPFYKTENPHFALLDEQLMAKTAENDDDIF